jgi:hypothetical protein
VAPAALVFTALAASGGFFYFFTSKRMAARQAAETAAVEQAAVVAKAAPAPALVQSAPAPAPAVPKPVVPEKPQFGFARPIDLGKDLAQSLTRKDWKRAAELAAAGRSKQPEQVDAARQVFEKLQQLGFAFDSTAEVEVLGQVEQFTRLAIPLKKADGSRSRLQLDVERDEDMGWKVAQFRLPPDLAQALAELPEASGDAKAAAPLAMVGAAGDKVPMSPTNGSSTLFAVEPQGDPLSVADEFVKKLLAHDFNSARQHLDESRVPSERLAGLCIVFEEGQYQLQAGKPLVMTAAGAVRPALRRVAAATATIVLLKDLMVRFMGSVDWVWIRQKRLVGIWVVASGSPGVGDPAVGLLARGHGFRMAIRVGGQ